MWHFGLWGSEVSRRGRVEGGMIGSERCGARGFVYRGILGATFRLELVQGQLTGFKVKAYGPRVKAYEGRWPLYLFPLYLNTAPQEPEQEPRIFAPLKQTPYLKGPPTHIS